MESFLHPVLFDADGSSWMFLTGSVCFCSKTRQERFGGDAGLVLFRPSSVSAKLKALPGRPFLPCRIPGRHCSFSVTLSDGAGHQLLPICRVCSQKQLEVFAYTLSFLLQTYLTAGDTRKEATKEVSGQWWQGEQRQPGNGKLSSAWESLRQNKGQERRRQSLYQGLLGGDEGKCFQTKRWEV